MLTKHPEYGKEEELMEEHYHCPLCSASYPTREEAVNCFLCHTENEILRYIAFEIFSSKHFAKNKKKPKPVDYTVWTLIEQLNEKFNFAEVDDGAVWNKSIRGKKL